jgi:excisionase family DNA binding protein
MIMRAMNQGVYRKIERGDMGMEGFLDPKGLAEALSIPVSQVYRLTQKGDLPHIRVGKYIRFNLDEVIRDLHRDGAGALL